MVLVKRLFVHCRSDEDLWNALTSGGMLGDTDYGEDEEEFAVTVWWAPDYPLPTFGSIMREWEEASLRMLPTGAFKGGDLGSLFESYVRDVSNQCEWVEEAIGHIAASTKKMDEITLGLHSIFYDSDNFLNM